mmetsp:Transcript_81113/g.173497  ORF Transcript_81113/g.173497 Transcript_81113/m.173497 type:complete len:523 (-) Transcript_81113:360-1928(-)
MPHCQKEFAKPPVSSKEKKAQQQAKREADKAKAARRAKEEEQEEARAKAEREQDPAVREAEEARAREAEKKEADAKRLREAKKKAGDAFKDGDYAEALARYSECIELEPEDHIHWSNRSAAHKQLAKFEEALADATKCTELSPEFAKGWARVGVANLALERLDEAEAAFEQGLSLEAENDACLDGLGDVKKARARSPEEQAFDALVKQLQGMDFTQLRGRALEEGLDEDRVAEAEYAEDPKGSLISFITAHKYLVDLIVQDLQGLDLEQLNERALQEGLAKEKVIEVADLDDPMTALTALIVKHLSNDLVDVTSDLQAEAAEEDEDSDDDDDADADIDFELVTMDESETRLQAGEMFLPGAYIDEKYGELVLPNGIRLGNRSLKMFYKQRLRPVNDRQLALRGHRQISSPESMDRLKDKIMRREEGKMYVKSLKSAKEAMSRAHCNALSKHSVYAENKAMRAVVHHWGGGGGGAHYSMAGGKQYNKGNKVKGVVLRHSVQGAKMQAARNKSNRGNKSVACLQ